MKKRITCTAALLAAAIAHADTRVGVELGQTLSGVGGPGVRVDLGIVQLDALVDGYYFTQALPNHGGAVEARAMVPVRRFADGWIGVAIGAAAADRVGTTPDGSEATVSGYAIDGALHAEWQIAPALSLGLDVGLTHQVGDGGPVPFPTGDGDADRVTSLGRPAGGASFTYWF